MMLSQEQKNVQAHEFERHTINLLSEYDRQKEVMKKVDKTLILYSVYDKKDEGFLCNLHAIGAGIISEKVAIKGRIQENQETEEKERYYQITVDEIRLAEIKVDFIKVSSKEENDFKNIRLYEGVVDGEAVRVVAVPIEKSLTNAGQASNLSAEITKMETELFMQTRDLQGQTLKNVRAQKQKKIDMKKREHENSMKDIHIKMFNIEALLNVVKEKTRVLSVCGFLGPKDALEEKKKETSKLFNIPEKATQYILHTHVKKTLQDQINNKSLSSVWSFDKDGTVKREKNNCFSAQFYWEEGRDIKTNIYSLMNDGRNTSLSTVIEEFNKTWNQITFNTTTCIGTIISRIYELLNYGEDLNGSFSSSKDSKTNMSMSANLTTTYTFQEIFNMYGVRENKNFRTNPESELKEFYTAKRLGKIKPEKAGGDVIPKSIQKIAFLHYFQKINRQFCEEYTNLERTDNRKLFSHVFQHLKQVYELVKAINDSFKPVQGENQDKPSVYCEDIQKYFNFLDFLLQSSTLIKSITGREFALESIKTFFEQLKSRDNKLLSYILNHEEVIKEGESLNYYDLYLLIIKENSKGAENNLDYIYLLIQKYKADEIFTRYGYSQKRSIEAIKGYSDIISNFAKIPEGKKDKFKKLEIEKNIARLLLNISLPEEAAKILMKNHLVRSAEKCFKQVLLKLHGDEKAKKYIEYGKFFETEFNFGKALEYYESAFEAARSTEARKEAIKTKIESSMRMLNPREDMKRMFVRFYTNQCTEEEFFDTPLKIESEQEIPEESESKSIFVRLRKMLKWDEQSKTTIFKEGPSEDDIVV